MIRLVYAEGGFWYNSIIMKMTRTDFLKSFGSCALLAAAGCRCPVPGCDGVRYALQIYSIHKIFWQSPERILESLAEAGFDGVEFYDYGGKSAKDLRKMCSDAGIAAMGTHLNGDVALVGDELRKTLDFAAEVGFESLVTPHALRKTADEYRQFGRQMGLAAEAAAPYGIKVGVHSTYHHFTTRFDGVSAWDVIYSEASPLLQQQIDTGNTFNTGEDVVALLGKYLGRHHSLHAKENVPTVDGVFGVPPTDGGKCVPWAEMLSCTKRDPSLKWWVVEAEGRPDIIEPSVKCLRQLRKWNNG